MPRPAGTHATARARMDAGRGVGRFWIGGSGAAVEPVEGVVARRNDVYSCRPGLGVAHHDGEEETCVPDVRIVVRMMARMFAGAATVFGCRWARQWSMVRRPLASVSAVGQAEQQQPENLSRTHSSRTRPRERA